MDVNKEIALIHSIYAKAFKPRPVDLTVSEWADKNRVLSGKAAAEPGRWKTSRTPYLKEPMDVLSVGSPVQRVVLKFGSQLGKTETLNNLIGYTADYAPAPILMVQPTLGMVKKASKQRLSPMIKESPSLLSKFAPERSREGSNTLFEKEFDGGILLLATAKSASELASMPIKIVCLDEIDRYDTDVRDEGDPIELAETRTSTFRNRKIVLTSTPTVAGVSNVEAEYEASDQREFYLPCPHCEEKQTLKFSNLQFDEENVKEVHYACEHCGGLIEEHNKTWMLANGEWIPKYPEREIRGYWLNSLYSPVGFLSWEAIVKRFLKAKKNASKLKVFVNTILAETWDEKGESPEHEKLYRRREDYPLKTVCKGGLFLTAGVDVQRNRIEVEVVAWGRDMETWSVDYRVYPGDTSQKEVWDKFWPILNETFDHESGAKLKIRQLAIDSSDQTQIVYKQVRDQKDHRVMAIKGSDSSIMTVSPPKDVDINYDGKKIYRGIQLWTVGVSLLKMELYGWLKQDPTKESNEPYPYGYCHFPQYDEEHFKRLTAESRKRKIVNGKTKYKWVAHHERNEQLDCRVYARAAAHVFGIDRFEEKHWKQLESMVQEPDDDPSTPKPEIKRRKTSYL